jgi:hypothetical protein
MHKILLILSWLMCVVTLSAAAESNKYLNSDKTSADFASCITTNTIGLPSVFIYDAIAIDPICQIYNSQWSNIEIWRTRQQRFSDSYTLLLQFLDQYPSLTTKLTKVAGYGIFDTTSVNLIFYAGAWGRGIVFDNQESQAIYVDTARVGTGLGLGYINEYTLVLFNNHLALEQFLAASMGNAQIGGDLNASVTFAIWTKYISFNPTITIYKLYNSGFNIQGNWGATVYWISPNIN